jgi:hypothetical protein
MMTLLFKSISRFPCCLFSFFVVTVLVMGVERLFQLKAACSEGLSQISGL